MTSTEQFVRQWYFRFTYLGGPTALCRDSLIAKEKTPCNNSIDVNNAGLEMCGYADVLCRRNASLCFVRPQGCTQHRL